MGETSEVGRGCERRRDGRVRGGLVALCAAQGNTRFRSDDWQLVVSPHARTQGWIGRVVRLRLLAGATVMGGAVVEVVGSGLYTGDGSGGGVRRQSSKVGTVVAVGGMEEVAR